MTDIPGIALAMPEGSKWRVYNHIRHLDLGQITVLKHRRTGLELHFEAADQVATLPYPENGTWALQGDHIRMSQGGKLAATYAPA